MQAECQTQAILDVQGFQHYLQVTDFTERVCLGTDCILFWAILLGPSSQHIVIFTAVVIIAVILLHILQVSSRAVVVNQIISLCTDGQLCLHTACLG